MSFPQKRCRLNNLQKGSFNSLEFSLAKHIYRMAKLLFRNIGEKSKPPGIYPGNRNLKILYAEYGFQKCSISANTENKIRQIQDLGKICETFNQLPSRTNNRVFRLLKNLNPDTSFAKFIHQPAYNLPGF